MADETLRELERALAAGGGPEVRLRYAQALARRGRPQEALQALAPLMEAKDALAQRARIHAAALYLEAGEPLAGLLVLNADFDDDARREYPALGRELEALLVVPELWATAARAIGKVAPLDELIRVFRAVPTARTGRFVARHILAKEIQARDKARAKELAAEEPDPEIARLLRAGGTLVL